MPKVRKGGGGIYYVIIILDMIFVDPKPPVVMAGRRPAMTTGGLDKFPICFIFKASNIRR